MQKKRTYAILLVVLLMAIDAHAYPWVSPYAYCEGNPITYVDPDGKGVFPNARELRTAGEQAMNNPKYQPNKGITYCNQGTQAINAMADDYSVTGLANEMGAYLRDASNATSISNSEALEYANMGVVVFASYINESGGHGHIAVVAPTESLTYSNDQKGYVVSVFNVGKTNGEMSLGRAFGKVSVGLYILNSDLEKIKNINNDINIDVDNALYFGADLEGITVTGISQGIRGALTQPATINTNCDILLNL